MPSRQVFSKLGTLAGLLMLALPTAPAVAQGERPASYNLGPSWYAGSLPITGQGTYYGAGYRHVNNSWIDGGAELFTNPSQLGVFYTSGSLGGIMPLQGLFQAPVSLAGGLEAGAQFDTAGGPGFWYLNAPVGVRYLLDRGPAHMVFEGAYYTNLLKDGFSAGQTPMHFRFTASISAGPFAIAGYKDFGITFNGFGGRVGLVF